MVPFAIVHWHRAISTPLLPNLCAGRGHIPGHQTFSKSDLGRGSQRQRASHLALWLGPWLFLCAQHLPRGQAASA